MGGGVGVGGGGGVGGAEVGSLSAMQLWALRLALAPAHKVTITGFVACFRCCVVIAPFVCFSLFLSLTFSNPLCSALPSHPTIN